MARSPLRRLALHVSNYSAANLLTTLAGVLSFPFLTHVFSVAEYGIMNLIAVAVTVGIALGKLGVQHSILRYYNDIKAGDRPYSLLQFTSTAVFGMLATGVVAALLAMGVVSVVPAAWLGGANVRTLFVIASLLIITGVADSAVQNWLRAELRSGVLRNYGVLKRWLGLGVMIATLVFVSRSLAAFYASSVLTETLAILALAWVAFRSHLTRPSSASYSRRLHGELLRFGIPMMLGYELSGTILSIGDRYVIHGFMGDEPLGLYSAAYNMCQYVQSIFIASVGLAILPMYMQMWTERGRDETAAFIGRSLRVYTVFAAPVIAGMAAVGPELLPLLASAKYESGAVIVSWVMAGMVVDGATVMLGAGLFIHRRTRAIMALVLASAVINVALNMFLIPRIGIRGAGIATLVAYAGLGLAMAIAGRRLMPLALPWLTLVHATIASLAMFFAVAAIRVGGSRLATIAVRVALGAAIYFGVMVVIAPEVRTILHATIARRRRPG